MDKFKVYISCPVSIPQSRINDFAKVIRGWGADVDFWQRGTTYNTLALDRADAVVVLLINNNWGQSFDTISSGTRSEMSSAYARIPIYLGYRNGHFENAIYETLGVGPNEGFRGIPGTSSSLKNRIIYWTKRKESEEETRYKSNAESKAKYLQSLKDKGVNPYRKPSDQYDSFTDVPLSPAVISVMQSLKNKDYAVNVFPKEQLQERIDELKTKYIMGIDPASDRVTTIEYLKYHLSKPPIVYGTPGQVQISDIGSKISDMFKGYRNKYGVPALACTDFIDHAGIHWNISVSKPEPKSSKTVSVMDKLKNKNQ